MSLTKKDVSQIKGIVHDEVENLARIVAKSFEGIDKRFEGIDKRLELIDKHIEEMNAEIRHINARLDTIEHDISAIHKHLVYRDEFEEALARISILEKKMGIRKSSARAS
ncbi:MAG: hypothetical protein AAB972_03005 [Patescibacteria group bacterium]